AFGSHRARAPAAPTCSAGPQRTSDRRGAVTEPGDREEALRARQREAGRARSGGGRRDGHAARPDRLTASIYARWRIGELGESAKASADGGSTGAGRRAERAGRRRP